MFRRSASTLCAGLLVCVLCGCAAPGGRGVWQNTGQGTEVNIYLEAPHAKFARWASGPGDELRFAGGSNAYQARWSWQGVLTPSQVATIEAIVTDANWLHSVPSGDGVAGGDVPGDVWHVTVASPSGHNSFTVYGHARSVGAVWKVFNEAGLARFAADEALVPKPDLDRYIQSHTGVRAGDAQGTQDRPSAEDE